MADFDPDSLLAELDKNNGTDELDNLMSELSALEVTNTPRGSQGFNELDNLMSQLGGAPAAKPAPRGPSQLSQSNVKANNDGMDELDQLMSSFGPSTPQKAPVAAKSNEMEDLDNLMNQLGAPVSSQGTRQPPIRANTVAVSSKPADNDDLDALMAELGGPSAPPAGRGAPAARGAAAPRGISTSATQPPVARGGGDDLDDLMNQLGGSPVPARGAPSNRAAPGRGTPVNRGAAPASRGSPAPRGAGTPTRGAPVNRGPAAKANDADDLDNLLNELGPSTPTNARPVSRSAAPGPSTPVNRVPSKPEDDLDALMNQLGGSPAPAQTAQARAQPTGINRTQTLQPSAAKPAEDDLDALMSQLGGSPAPVQARAQPTGINRAQTLQPSQAKPAEDDLDALMSQLGGSPAPAARPASVAPGRTASPGLRSSSGAPGPSTPVNRVPSKPEDDLDALMNQLGGTPTPAKTASPSTLRSSSGAKPPAATDDLDALMNQLGGPAPARAAPRGINQAATARPAPKTSPATDDLDDLMNQLGGPAAGRAAPRGINQASTSMSPNTHSPVMNDNRAAPRGINHAATARPAQNTGGSDLDDLMNQLSGSGSQPATRGINQSASVRSTSSVQSSSTDLDDLMNQLSGSGSQPARGINQSASVRSTSSVQSSSTDLDDLMATLEGPGAGRPLSQSGGFGRSSAPGSPAVGRGQPGINNQNSFNSPPVGRGQPGINTQNSFNSQSSYNAPGGRGQPGLNTQSSFNSQSSFSSQSFNSPPVGRGRGAPPNFNAPAGNTYSPRTPGNYPPPGSPYAGRGGPSDLDSLLGSLNQQLGDINDGSTASRGICGFCQKHILSECIQALGKTFHPEHFVCFTCQTPLGTNSFYETNGEPNCERCYQSMYCPMCAFCQKAIADRCVTAMNKKWHVECFVCNSCCNSFQGGSFFEKNGMPYCQNCFYNTFATRCAGCQQVTTGRIINALNQQWHQECFACAYCRRPFNGQAFYEKDGKPYCEAHYHTASGAVCAGCKEAIVGRCVDALGKKYHPEHFICNYCLNPLAGGGYTEQNGAPYCQECYANLF